MTNYNIPLRKSIRHVLVYYFARINLKTISKLYLLYLIWRKTQNTVRDAVDSSTNIKETIVD